LIVFLLAAITDYFDGALARKLKSITDFGKVVDPLADKIIVSVALITIALSPMRFISIYVVYIIILRELLVTLLRSWYQKRDIYVAANIWGKLKTTYQMIGIVAALIFNAGRYRIEFLQNHEDLFILILQIFFWYVAVITVVSGITYLPFLKKGLKRG
jgi:CDP-diacylglycerol--glycerol-3-phosphate 3-phosphatidyltransferase